MYKLNFKEHFLKKYVKLVKRDQKLDEKIRKVLNKLSADPKDTSLKCHHVYSPIFGKLWTCRITGDLRIIWDYSKEHILILDIFDIGEHEGKRKVYK